MHRHHRRRRVLLIVAAIALGAVIALFLALPTPPPYSEDELWESFSEEGTAAPHGVPLASQVAPQGFQGAEWSLSAVRHSALGAHADFVQTLGGRFVVGSWARRHDFANGRFRFEGRKSTLPAPDVAPAQSVDALAVAREGLGIGALRGEPVVREAFLPTVRGFQPVRVVDVPALEPPADWRVIVDETTGEILSAVDLLCHATGTGTVFERVPGIACGMELAARDADLLPYTSAVELHRLDGTGYLSGERVFVFSRYAERVYDSDLRFHYPPSHPGFEQVMCYHTIDSYLDHVLAIGVQGYGDKRFAVDAHGYSGDNSFFSPLTGRITFGDGGIPDAQDPEIILHELGHALHWTAVPDYATSGTSRTVSEGLADYLACSHYDNPLLAEWDAAAYSHDCPPHLRRLDILRRYPDDAVGEVHQDGLIWASTLWGIRRAVGSQITDRTLLESLFLLRPTSGMRHAAYAFLESDQMLYGGEHSAVIVEVLQAHGLLSEGESPPASAPTISARAYPNPFNPQTKLRFLLPQSGRVRIDVADVSGRVLTTLLDGQMSAGNHFVEWDGRDRSGKRLPSGVYLYRITSPAQSISGKLILLQ